MAMQMIMVNPLYYYGAIVLGVLVPILTMMVMVSIFKAVPWAMTMYRAYKRNIPMVYLHPPAGSCEFALPEFESGLKNGVPVTYLIIKKWGIKFLDSAGEASEILHGKVRVIHYFKKNPAPVPILDVVAIDRLKAWFKTKGIVIDHIEDIFMTILSDVEKTNNLKAAIESSKIDSAQTKNTIIKAINTLYANRQEVERLRIKDGTFVFQTAAMALDKTIAFTSAAVANAFSAIEAQVRAKQAEDKQKVIIQLIMVGAIAVFIILIGLAAFWKMTSV